MAILGFNDLKQIALPAGVDPDDLATYALREGTTAEAVFDTVIAGAIAQAQALLNDPIIGGMIHITDDPMVEYRQGATETGMDERSEYGRGDARRSGTIAHQLPEKSYDRDLGFTEDFLRKARMKQIEANLADVMYDVQDEFERQSLSRFFTSTDTQLNNSGYDVGLINGGANVAYIPPAYSGQTFASTHDHFDRQADSAAGRLAAAKAGVETIAEHGIWGNPYYIGIIPWADVGDWEGVTGFKKLERSNIVYGSSVDVAQLDENVFVGMLEVDRGIIALHATGRVPANYFGMYRSYGFDDSRNPLHVWTAPDYGFSPVAKPGKGWGSYPMEDLRIIHEYGVGGGNRLNGYCSYFAASGNYTDPTIL